VRPVLLDTGFVVALLHRSERFHKVCARTVRELGAPLITCEAVIAESCYLLRNLSGAPGAVIENIAAGIFQVPFQLSQETAGVRQILRKYRDRQMELADACLIHLADQFGTADILTLDQDFAIYRWAKTNPFDCYRARISGKPREERERVGMTAQSLGTRKARPG
jgi:predicted nucleic acid-binding protein